jgi:hypothetical protein
VKTSLENKLALLVNYVYERTFNGERVSMDAPALKSLLDDPEVADWRDQMQKAGRIVNDRFTYKR